MPSQFAWAVVASLAVGGAFVALLAVVRSVSRMALPLAGTVALALLVCFETALMNVLSPWHGVSRWPVLAGHAACAVAAWCWLRARSRIGVSSLWRGGKKAADPRLLVLVPIAALVVASALRYAPNSGDAMTYHLARVAHWMQHRSVGSYPTGSIRQTVMMPGAEYVLLALQVISRTDRLASLPQLGSFVLLVLSGPPLARLAGAPSRLAFVAAPLVATLPMAILQGSSTQNDIVAGVMTIALVATCLPFLHAGRSRAVPPEALLLLAACCAAAVLVKANAFVAGAPFLLLAALGTVRRWRALTRTGAKALMLAGLLGAVLVVPELARRQTPSGTDLLRPFVYDALGEWGDRAANVVRGVFHELPPPDGLPAPLQPALPGFAAATARFRSLGILAAHEELAGNPIQAALILVALVLLVARRRSIPARGRVAMLATAASWCAFHLILRDNEYLSRLHLPLFALSPVYLTVLAAARGAAARRVALASIAVVLAMVAHATVVAAQNELRPPLVARNGPRSLDYYRNHGAERLRDPQSAALRVARRFGCRRLGLFMGESGFDYPITWQAMNAGIETRRLVGPDDWPCVLYFEKSSWWGWNLPTPKIELAPSEWAPVGGDFAGPFLFVRRGIHDPDRASGTSAGGAR